MTRSVLYAAPGLWLRPGHGPTEHFLALARALARQPDVDLKLLIGEGPGTLPEGDLPASAKVHWLPRPEGAWAVTDCLALGTDPRRYRAHHRLLDAKAREILAGGVPDLVVERMWGFGGFLGRQLQKRGARWVLEENGPPRMEPHERRWTDLLRVLYLRVSHAHLARMYQCADALVVQSPALRLLLETTYGVAGERIRVLANGVDRELLTLATDEPSRQEARRALGWPAEERALFYGGSLDRSHPVAAMVDAYLATPACHRSTRLRILGSGPWRDELGQRAAAPGSPLVVGDPVPRRELWRHLQAADLVLAPYDTSLDGRHGFLFSPLKVREALGLDRPVAVTAAAAGGLVAAGEQGFLVPGPEGWTELFASLPGREALALLGRGNRAQVASWTYDDVASGYLEGVRSTPRESA